MGRKGMQDPEIITVLHQASQVTFFTRGFDFFSKSLCHKNYCIVCLAVGVHEAASFIRRFLKQPLFNVKNNRLGKVIRVSHSELRVFALNSPDFETLQWTK
jgi:hypothetical protein